MIYFDVTKTAAAGHRSGLMRVSQRLLEEGKSSLHPVSWPEWRGENVQAGDWFLTPELFSEAERPGFERFLQERKCRCAAIFHDAIPLRFPSFTWPQSVSRHPGYMKMLAGFDRVWAVSEASRRDLLGFWRWQGIESPPSVEVLALGANFDRSVARRTSASLPMKEEKITTEAKSTPQFLAVGILEPRKNQSFLLEVCAELWRDGLLFELHLVGRVNPHFGKPVRAQVRALQKEFRGLRFHAAASDRALAALYETARATLFPTIAEGCGLPLLESLWLGVPCVASDLPVLRENADEGGCLLAAPNDREAWKTALRRVVQDDELYRRLKNETLQRPLPTWGEAARTLTSRLAE